MNKKRIYELQEEIKAVKEISCVCGTIVCEEVHDDIPSLLRIRDQQGKTNYFYIKEKENNKFKISILKPNFTTHN